MIRLLLAGTALALTTACATTELEPIDAAAFVEAHPLEEEVDLPVEIVETAIPLPLPGQMMPVSEGETRRTYMRTVTASASPAEAIEEGREHALVEPSVDGYVNAIQVYPYTEGALYRLYASPGQVSDIALQPGETLVSVSAGDTVRWVVGDTISGSGPTARTSRSPRPPSGRTRSSARCTWRPRRP